MHQHIAANLPGDVEHVIVSGVAGRHLQEVTDAYVKAGVVPVTERSGQGGWTAVLLERR